MRCLRFLVVALAVTGLSQTAQASLVTNGGFEAGNFSGWNLSSGPSGGFFSTTTFTGHQGTTSAVFGATGTGLDTISQPLSTVAGATYDSSSWLRVGSVTVGNPIPAQNNAFQFNGDGGAVDLNLLDAPGQAFTRHGFSLQASSASTAISFAGRSGVSVMNFDTVSVTQQVSTLNVPEPATQALVCLAALAAGTARRARAAAGRG